MDDIMAQLQLQRQRQKQGKDIDAAAAAAEGNEGKKSKKRTAAAPIKQEIGDFRFDPISNRYLPKSSFNMPDDDNNAQKVSQNVSIDRLRWGKRNSISDEDLRRVLFRGSALNCSCPPMSNTRAQKNSKKHQRDHDSIDDSHQQVIPCSERIVQLLTTSLQYTNYSHKRNAIVNILGPVAIARGANVVASAVSEDMLSSFTKSKKSREVSETEYVQQPVPIQTQPQYTTTTVKLFAARSSLNTLNQSWYSLLQPMIPSRVALTPGLSSVILPYDCACKHLLPPTAATFDIQSHPNSIPSVVTLANHELFCRQNYSIPPEGARALQIDDPPDDNSAWELSISDSVHRRMCLCVRFAPSSNHIGILAQCSSINFNDFVFKNFGLRNTRMHAFSGLDQMNDFCFSLDGKTVRYRTFYPFPRILLLRVSSSCTDHHEHTVAFAHGADSESGVSYLDIDTGGYLRFPKHNRSEALTVQYLGDQLLCGHRDGSLSLHDRRGNNEVVSTPALPKLFGSATSIHPLQDGNSVVVKGSFGSCRVLDVRKLQNSNSGSSSKAALMDLRVPTPLVHKTNSTRCTGVALDPTETIVISPFAGKNNVSFALWCIKTGMLLRSIDLGKTNNNSQLPPFCELSSKTTSGFAIKQCRGSTWPRIAKDSDFGIWFKSGQLHPSSPPNFGGIHHLSFPK